METIRNAMITVNVYDRIREIDLKDEVPVG